MLTSATFNEQLRWCACFGQDWFFKMTWKAVMLICWVFLGVWILRRLSGHNVALAYFDSSWMSSKLSCLCWPVGGCRVCHSMGGLSSHFLHVFARVPVMFPSAVCIPSVSAAKHAVRWFLCANLALAQADPHFNHAQFCEMNIIGIHRL